MWINRGPELPFVPKAFFEMWSGDKAIEWRAAKYRGHTLVDGPDPDRSCDPSLDWDDCSSVPGTPDDRSVMPILRALHEGQLTALIQLESGFQPVPKEVWAPNKKGEWPVGWLLGQLDEFPFGEASPRDIDLPFRGATVMFLDSDFKRWAGSQAGKPQLPADEPDAATYTEVERWLKSFDCNQVTHEDLCKIAKKHFAPRSVVPFHVKRARREIEGGPRRPGPKIAI